MFNFTVHNLYEGNYTYRYINTFFWYLIFNAVYLEELDLELERKCLYLSFYGTIIFFAELFRIE